MFKFAALSAIALAAGLATAAHADDTTGYYKVGYSNTDLSKSSKSFNGLTLGASFQVWKFVSLEGSFDTGVGDNTSGSGVNRTKYELDHQVAATLVASHAVSNGFEIQGRLGFMQTKITTKTPTAGASDHSVSGPSLGVGLNYFPHDSKAGVALTWDHADFSKTAGNNDIVRIAYIHKY